MTPIVDTKTAAAAMTSIRREPLPACAPAASCAYGGGDGGMRRIGDSGCGLDYASWCCGGGAGVYIANADGTGKAVKVYAGAATGVDWGPAPKD